jgi:hypothetical protein
MVASDRLLVALGEYLSETVDWVAIGIPGGVTPRMRDYEGSKGSLNVTLDAEEPEEHEVLDGVYSVMGKILLEMKARDVSETIRRELLAGVESALTVAGVSLTACVEWLNDDENERGIGEEELEVYDLRSDSGAWRVEDDWFVGEVGFTAQFRGAVS